MADLGTFNTLQIIEQSPYGAFLDGGELGKVLLPTKLCPKGYKTGDTVEVFLYLDGDNQAVATTQRPYATVGQFALLKVVATNSAGAFLNWGLRKDLLVPFSEQRRPMQEGHSYLVYINLDDVGRVVASSKIEKFLDQWPITYEPGQAVDLIICEPSDIGIKAIINHRHWGVLYEAETFKKLKYGQKIRGYIKQVREDEKIDLTLHRPGHQKLSEMAQRIMEKLQQNDGFLPLNDKSPPEAIYKTFGESKKTFKNAIGTLYKSRLITIDNTGIKMKER
ncbi:MAG TPA: GntR family transcriptional regulator [Candidatus Tenderia sp.]|nr:GntR family transcriptional regulator [Candidatus Tenderia sp.]